MLNLYRYFKRQTNAFPPQWKSEAEMQALLTEIRETTSLFRVLGSYPKAALS